MKMTPIAEANSEASDEPAHPYCLASARKLKSETMDGGSEQKRTGILFRFKHFKLILTMKTISRGILALKLHRRTAKIRQ